MRHPAVAGSFYPSNPDSLLAMLREFVSPNPDPSIVACVAPHAGYMYSGRTAGRVYSLLPQVETYVIVGPNHTGYGSAVAVSTDTWLTPLGKVEVDREFVEALPKRIIDMDEIAHRYEHSLEVQVPFEGIPSGSLLATVVLPPAVEVDSASVIREKTSAADFRATTGWQHDVDQTDLAQFLEDPTRLVAQAGRLSHLV